jgi:hypothetical protein
MSARALTLYDPDSDSDASSLAGDERPLVSMSIANDPCNRDSNSDRFALDSDLETTYSDSEEEYITSEQAQKYNPAGLRVEARRTLDYDSESDDDGDANRGYNAQSAGGFNRSVMANGLKDDEDSIGDDSDYDPIIRGRKDLPRAFVSSDAELTALLPVGHARDKRITTSTINAETGEKEIHQYREGEQDRPDRVVKITTEAKKSAKESADIVAKALSRARQAKAVKTGGGKGVEVPLTKEETEKETRRGRALAKTAFNVKKIAYEAAGEKADETLARLPKERQEQITKKVEQLRGKKNVRLREEIAKLPEERKKEVLTKYRQPKLDALEKRVDKMMKSEVFKKLTAAKQAKDLLKRVGQTVTKLKAGSLITTTFKRLVGELRAKAATESKELEEEIVKQQRHVLAMLISKSSKGTTEGDKGDEASTIAGEARTEGTDPRTAQLSVAKEEMERMQAEVEPIMVDGKEVKIALIGSVKKIMYDGKPITSNEAYRPILLKLQAELGKTRRTDPVANAIRSVVDKRISQVKARGNGKAQTSTKANAGAGKE